MKILIINTGSYIHNDLFNKLRQMGYSCSVLNYLFDHSNWESKYHNDEFEAVFSKELTVGYDCVITTNFFPIIARICYKQGIKYLAWSYDSPMNLPGTEEMEHPTNYIFLFDSADCERYRNLGLGNIYHLPLAVNCDRLDGYHSVPEFETDVSLLGKLYESTLPALKSMMNDYQAEFVDKLVQTQLKVYGNWFVDEMLTDGIIEDINSHFRSSSSDALQITRAQLSYSIAQMITFTERISLLRLMHNSGFKTDLYTYQLSEAGKQLLKDIRVHGPLDYIREMPVLFKSSRINLNPTMKNIKSGISLRVLDVLGSGGFLLTNFQPEIAEHFEDGRDLVMYRSMEEAVDKAGYYLAHDEERNKIAASGYGKVRKEHTYENRISVMFSIAGLA